MRLTLITEKKKDKGFFDYHVIAKSMWRDKVKEAQKKFGILFDLENDESVGVQRTITIKDNKFRCELFSAGGDWESTVRYFRCQIADGYLDSRSEYHEPYFVFIPGKKGNPHLEKSKNKLIAPDAGYKDKNKPNDRACWDELKHYLTKTVKDAGHSSD